MTRQEFLETVRWAPQYRPGWDQTPERYLEAGLIKWGKGRRLGLAEDPARGFKAYFGVQHYDPSMWGVPGAPRCQYFVSLWSDGVCRTMRSFPTMSQAIEAAWEFCRSLRPIASRRSLQR
jgi:hypothetical protein